MMPWLCSVQALSDIFCQYRTTRYISTTDRLLLVLWLSDVLIWRSSKPASRRTSIILSFVMTHFLFFSKLNSVWTMFMYFSLFEPVLVFSFRKIFFLLFRCRLVDDWHVRYLETHFDTVELLWWRGCGLLPVTDRLGKAEKYENNFYFHFHSLKSQGIQL